VEQQRHPRRPRTVWEQLSEAGAGAGTDARPVGLQVAGQQQPAGLVDLVLERLGAGFVEHPAHHPVRAASRRSAQDAVAQTGGVALSRVFSADNQHVRRLAAVRDQLAGCAHLTPLLRAGHPGEAAARRLRRPDLQHPRAGHHCRPWQTVGTRSELRPRPRRQRTPPLRSVSSRVLARSGRRAPADSTLRPWLRPDPGRR